MSKKTTKAEVLADYIEIVRECGGKSPSHAIMESRGLTRNTARYHFGTIKALDDAARRSEGSLFSDVPLADLKPVSQLYGQRFIVTTAVVGCEVNLPFLQAMRTYANVNEAEILVVPCADPASQRSPNGKGRLDRRLTEYGCTILPYQDYDLNDNLKILGVRLSAKMIKPLTGLPRFGSRGTSLIVASPKQSLEYVATVLKHPHAIMTTGACTVPDYRSDHHRSHRTAFFAEQDHVIGAVIVEIKSDKIFDFRHIEADDRGGFFDWGTYYDATSKVEAPPEAIVMGDWHSAILDHRCGFFAMTNPFNAKKIFLHDSFDGATPEVNHHAMKAINSFDYNVRPLSLQDELAKWCADLSQLSEVYEEVYIVPSNHDDRLTRWLSEGKFVKDVRHKKIGSELNAAMHRGEYPLEYWFRKQCPDAQGVIFIKTHDVVTVGRVNLSSHGHRGSNGARGSMPGFDQSLGYNIHGHTHSAAIFRQSGRVGHSCDLDLVGYTEGSSSWTHTHALVYPDGRYQLYNIIPSE